MPEEVVVRVQDKQGCVRGNGGRAVGSAQRLSGMPLAQKTGSMVLSLTEMSTTRMGGSRLEVRVGRGEFASVQGAVWCVGESELSGSEQGILAPEIRWLS